MKLMQQHIEYFDEYPRRGSSNNKRIYNDVNVTDAEIYLQALHVYVRNYTKRHAAPTFHYFMHGFCAQRSSSTISFMSNRFECYT